MTNHVTYKHTDDTLLEIANFKNGSLTSSNPDLELTVAPDGTKDVVKFVGGQTMPIIKLPSPINLYPYYGIRFRVYSERATGTTVCLQLESAQDKPPHMSVAFEVNFTGWKDFFAIVRDLSVQVPFPSFDGLSVKGSGMSMIGNLTGDIPENVLYLDNIVAQTANFEITAPDGMSLDNPALYRSITDKYRTMMLGDESVWETEAFKNNVKNSDSKCEETWAQFKETWSDGEKGQLFGLDIARRPWNDEKSTMTLIARLFFMTQGWAKRGKYYHNPELLADIMAGLEYANKYYYGKNIINEGTFGNWWEWNVGIPLNLMPMLVLLEDELGPDLLKKYLEPFDYITPYPMGSGANQMWTARVCIISGALQFSAHRICSAKHYMMNIFEFADEATRDGDGGFYTDGSFVQHHQHPYTTGYGMGAVDELTVTMLLTAGGPFEFTEDIVKNHYEWAFRSFLPIVYKKNASNTLAGRNVSRGVTEVGNTKGIFRSLARMCHYAPADIQAKLKPALKRIMADFGRDMCDVVSMTEVQMCRELWRDNSISPASRLIGTRVFPAMRRVAHYTEKFGAMLSLSGTHIAKYESINNENKTGWHYGDGMLTVFTDGYDFGKEFYLYASPYLVPATTENTAKKNPVCIGMILNGSDFSGGLECEEYGVAAYQHKLFERSYKSRMFFDEKDARLSANKSYFFFDKEIVCLGSAIKDVSGTPVITTVDNRLWRENDKFTVNGQAADITDEMTALNENNAHFTNMGGYVFLSENPVKYRKVTNSGVKQDDGNLVFAHATSSADFLELVIEHGIGNEGLNGSYAYAYLPTATADETVVYGNLPEISVVKQTDSVHAVAKPSLNMLGAVFFAPDTLEYNGLTLCVDSPCVISIRDNLLYLADVTQALDTVTVNVNGVDRKADLSARKGLTVKINI